MTDIEPTTVQGELVEAGQVASRCTWGLNVLAIPEDLSFTEWAKLGNIVALAGQAAKWHHGDWLVYGETHYEVDDDGNVISNGVAQVNQLLSDLGLEPSVRARRRAVSVKFPRIEDRHEDLSWAHHLEVAALDTSDAHRLLNEASVEGWSTRDLREHVRRLQAIDTTGQETLPGLGKPHRLTVRFGAGVIGDPKVLEEAATRIGQVLTDLGLDGEVKVA